MNVAVLIPKRLIALSLFLLGLALLGACTPTPTPEVTPQEEPPVEAAEAEPAILEDGVGAYIEPVIEEAPDPLGTAWGESISSSIGRADVSRLTALPAQTMNMHYSGDAPRGKVSNELQLLDRTVHVRILREDGTPWPIYQVDGEVHLQGEVGERYIVEVENVSASQAIEFALSVDGIAQNNGRPAKPWGRGFIIDPERSWRFEGFRKSDDEVAAFRFSDVGNSVAITRGSGSAGDAGVINFRIYEVEYN